MGEIEHVKQRYFFSYNMVDNKGEIIGYNDATLTCTIGTSFTELRNKILTEAKQYNSDVTAIHLLSLNMIDVL